MIAKIVRNLTTLRRIWETGQEIFSNEWIEINGLEVTGKIGVPEIERETPQRMIVSLRFQIGTRFAALNDQLKKTIDYAEVAAEVEKVIQTTEAQLIEKLVSEISDALMERFPMKRLEIELRKFILRKARYVSVKTDRKRAGGSDRKAYQRYPASSSN